MLLQQIRSWGRNRHRRMHQSIVHCNCRNQIPDCHILGEAVAVQQVGTGELRYVEVVGVMVVHQTEVAFGARAECVPPYELADRDPQVQI